MSSFSAISPTSVSSQPAVSVPPADSFVSSVSEVAAPTGVSAIAPSDAMVRTPQNAQSLEKVEPGFVYRMKQKFWANIVA